MLPCFDEPCFKVLSIYLFFCSVVMVYLQATFSLSATVPSFYTVLFNSAVEETSAAGPALTRHRFATTPKMPIYVLALFVGGQAKLKFDDVFSCFCFLYRG